jgi:uncharacterized protein with GYD domain
VPFHWVRMPSSPPTERRNEVHQICQSHGAKLANNEIYYGDDDQIAFALIEVPDDSTQQQALLNALSAIEAHGKVNADEKAAGKPPPPNHPPT